MVAAVHSALRAAEPPVKYVSTDGIRASERREFWEAGASVLFGSLRLEQLSREAFQASAEYTNIGDLLFCRLSASVPHRIFRTGTGHDSQGFVKAVLQTKGSTIVSQAGRTTPLHTGDWTLYDMELPYTVNTAGPVELTMLMIPREKALPLAYDLRDVVLRRFAGRRGLGKLMWSFAGATFDQIPEIYSRSGHDVADIVAQMFRLALLELFDERAPVSSKDALRERVKAYISSHLRDPDLSIERLASATHCSKRYLHLIFRPENVSISDYILRSRLGRCRADLLNPACAHRSIAEIAYSWGFNNSNHFSRCFKRAFGISPREVRVEWTAWSAEPSPSRVRPS